MSGATIFLSLFAVGAYGYWAGWSDRLRRKRKTDGLPAYELSHLSARELRDDYERLQVENKRLRDELQWLRTHHARAHKVLSLAHHEHAE